jgi:DNA replication protein DnaC
MNPELSTKLRYLRLSGMAESLPLRNQEAISSNLSFTEFLELLVEDELARRRDRLHARRVKLARLPEIKTLDTFDFSFNPSVPKALILDMACCRFVPAAGGALLVGPPGVGKSHLAIGLALSAIRAGYTVAHRSAFDLAGELAEASACGTRREVIDTLVKPDLLLIEDLGMKRLPASAAEDLLEVFARRYGRGAVIVTTNRPIEDWGEVLGDTAAAGAILDRFLHRAELVQIKGRSYRLHERKQRRLDQENNQDLA